MKKLSLQLPGSIRGRKSFHIRIFQSLKRAPNSRYKTYRYNTNVIAIRHSMTPVFPIARGFNVRNPQKLLRKD